VDAPRTQTRMDGVAQKMTDFEKTIGWTFSDPALLERALTSPACRMDHPGIADNQRLEFLGDAVFGLLSADAVYAAFPDEKEGPLTVRRTHLVSTAALAAAAERIGVREYLKRNRGAAELPKNAKALTDALEAVMGAAWLDGGYEAARTVFDRLGLAEDAVYDEWEENPKGRLQVIAQSLRPPRKPHYEVVSSTGPSHAPVVTVKVSVEGLGEATATAVSNRAAEVAAAEEFLKQHDGAAGAERKG